MTPKFQSSPSTVMESGDQLQQWPLRCPELVMDVNRLGRLHQSRLSFMRLLVRRMVQEQWKITTTRFDLDENGYGTVVYTLNANGNEYNFVAFSDYLADEERNDRVIAEKWDVTMAFCIGGVDDGFIQQLRLNVPKQEAGRVNAKVMVLSRGNKSSRNFDYVVDQLSNGLQPDPEILAKVGYLYRTTAVYGSGKFGMADWLKVEKYCPEFAHPFSAEMFTCYLLRQFSLDQAEFLAKQKSAESAVPLDPKIKRYFGIGNSTGLGMAPYLIRHPMLISRWILCREKAIARVTNEGVVSVASVSRLIAILNKCAIHVTQTTVPDATQIAYNDRLMQELYELIEWFEQRRNSYHIENTNWLALVAYVASTMSIETQELLNSALMELHPKLVDEFEQYACVDEQYQIQPHQTVGQLKSLIEGSYSWALAIDFTQPSANHFFWYRSEEKMEPRLGQRFSEPGADKEMPLPIARIVSQCYALVKDDIRRHGEQSTVAELLLREPSISSIVKRIQTMSQEQYGEIRANLADVDMLPMDLLRCKLSFFGVSKFDPKSKLWVRNTMFQGAPVVSEINQADPGLFLDDWYFPIMPTGEL